VVETDGYQAGGFSGSESERVAVSQTPNEADGTDRRRRPDCGVF